MSYDFEEARGGATAARRALELPEEAEAKRQRSVEPGHVGPEGLVTPVGYATGGAAQAIQPYVPPPAAGAPVSLVPLGSLVPVSSPSPPVVSAAERQLSDALAQSAAAVAQAQAQATESATQAGAFRRAAEMATCQAAATAVENARVLQRTGEAVRQIADREEQLQSAVVTATNALANREQELQAAALSASLALQDRENALQLATSAAETALVRREQDLVVASQAQTAQVVEQTRAKLSAEARSAIQQTEQDLVVTSQAQAAQVVEQMRAKFRAEANAAVQQTREEAERRHADAVKRVEDTFSAQLQRVRGDCEAQGRTLLEVKTELLNAQEKIAHLEDEHQALQRKLTATVAERDQERSAREALEQTLLQVRQQWANREKEHQLQLLNAEGVVATHKQRADEMETKLQLALSQQPTALADAVSEIKKRDDQLTLLRSGVSDRDAKIESLQTDLENVKLRLVAVTDAPQALEGPQRFRMNSRSPGAETKYSVEQQYAQLGGTAASPPSFEGQKGGPPSAVPQGPVSGRDTPVSYTGSALPAQTSWSAARPQIFGGSSVRGRSPGQAEPSAVPQSTLKMSLGDKVLGQIKMPTAASQLPAFKEAVRCSVSACAVSSDLAWKWIKVVERPGLDLTSLSESTALLDIEGDNQELSRLDFKLKQEMTQKISESGLVNYVRRHELQHQDQHERPLKGRQVLWLLYEYFSVGDTHEKIHNMHTLMKIEWKGDDHISTFLDDWTDVWSQLKVKPDADTTREILMAQVRKSNREMKHTLEEWDKLEPSQQTAQWMLAALNRKVATKRKLANMADVSNSVTGNRKGQSQPAAPSAQGGGAKPTCKFWKQGSCEKGNSCPYPHTPGQKGINKPNAGAPSAPAPAGKSGSGGQGQQNKGSGGSGKPANLKHLPCWDFADGKCAKKEADCLFSHRPLSEKEAAQKAKAGRKKDGRSPSPGANTKICAEFAKTGSCKKVDCKFNHPGQTRKN